jgi:outer membrane protein OmpA-like peptidoglycan-associated protein
MVNQMLMGDTTTKIWNTQFKGKHEARGVFYSKNTAIPIKEGILLSTGSAADASGPNKGTGFSGSNQTKGDAQLKALANYKTYDATWLSFEFEPQLNLIRFNYVFASEEYPEYVGSTFNDVFGFFLTDLETGVTTNLAVIPNTDLPITVNNINHRTHKDFYIRNPEMSSRQIEFDGMTQPLIAYSEVTPGKKYKIKIAIADVGDDAFDSGVFLEGKSFKSEDKKQFFEDNQAYFEAFSNTEMVKENTPKNTTKLDPVPTPKPTKTGQSAPTSIPKTKSTVGIDSLLIYFDFNQSTASESQLSNAKKGLSHLDFSKYSLEIEGHTDQRGTNTYNHYLSTQRAVFVQNWISSEFSQEVKQIKGYSFNQLAQSQTTPSARTKNRRVVIRLVPKSR